jgi:poly-gamma-glutamate synthesis protein (capsule biosynthesis protein)
MYFASFEPRNGELLSLRMVPVQIKRFRVNDASEADARWLWMTLDRETRKLGCQVELKERQLWLKWR